MSFLMNDHDFIPLMLIINLMWGINGLIWAQPVADIINAGFSIVIFFLTRKRVFAVEIPSNKDENPIPNILQDDPSCAAFA